MHLVRGARLHNVYGPHTRSFMRIDDRIERVLRIDAASPTQPLIPGSSEPVTINRLAEMAESLGGITLQREHFSGCEPHPPLHEGLEQTYRWIEAEFALQT